MDAAFPVSLLAEDGGPPGLELRDLRGQREPGGYCCRSFLAFSAFL